MRAAHSILIAVGCLAVLGAAFALTRYGAPPKAVLETRLTYEAAWWGAAAVAVFHALFVERRPPASFGLRAPTWRDLAVAAGAGALILAGIVFVYMALFPILLLSISISHIPDTMFMPYWYRAAMVVRVAVAGELLFRAFVIEHGETLLPGWGKWLAATLSLAAFVAADWSSWSPVESIATFFAGLVLTLLYLWRRNLAVNAIAAFIGLGAGYLLSYP